ncbi:MAG TPA: hypothetical protein VK712_02835 [Verrucomicrobiae bacterium]|jgi:hypothetical protein|nr:hypothetical protein [Verrucomicrobiae bacterium]
MDVSTPIFPAVPRWVAWVYGVLAILTVPWTVYLGISLPTRHLTSHWDVAWVGLDIAIICMLLLNAFYAYRESKWLVMSATATSTLLITDAWFDITSARGRSLAEALASAIIIELPLAILTFRVALHLVRREHIKIASPDS